jgi:hypothetical protein
MNGQAKCKTAWNMTTTLILTGQDFILALQIYGEKTGTGVNQWYPLEPWMFTVVVLWLVARQDPKNWQDIGFILLQDCSIQESHAFP